MKVTNMTSSKGNTVPNQFIIQGYDNLGKAGEPMITVKTEVFQSYNSTIAKKIYIDGTIDIVLDEKYWDYSVTTGKYRNEFLGETKKETQKRINSGEYTLTNLN